MRFIFVRGLKGMFLWDKEIATRYSKYDVGLSETWGKGNLLNFTAVSTMIIYITDLTLNLDNILADRPIRQKPSCSRPGFGFGEAACESIYWWFWPLNLWFGWPDVFDTGNFHRFKWKFRVSILWFCSDLTVDDVWHGFCTPFSCPWWFWHVLTSLSPVDYPLVN